MLLESEVVVYILEGWYVNCLFVDHPDMASKFYSYLCSTLAKRLIEREQEAKKTKVLSFNLFVCSVRHAFSWKVMQSNIVVLIQDIIYPLLCISDDDIELFNDEPIEFVRARLGIEKKMKCFQLNLIFFVRYFG